MNNIAYYAREVERLKKARFEYWLRAKNADDPNRCLSYTRQYVAAKNELRATQWALDNERRATR